MTSRAEAIADALEVAFTVPPMTAVPAARVFRERDAALRSALFPAVVVELGDEQAPQSVLISKKDRFLDVLVTVLAASYSAGDAALVETFGRIFADRTLGGIALDVVEGETSRDTESAGELAATTRKRYTVHYRTAESSMES